MVVLGGGQFLMSEVPLYLEQSEEKDHIPRYSYPLAAASAFAERVHLNDSGTNLIHCHEFQPKSRPHIRSKRTPVAAKWWVVGVGTELTW